MPKSRYLIGNLPWYSVLIVIGICLAIYLSSKEEKRLGLPKDTVIDLALSLIPLGIIGARLYYVVFAWDSFRNNPISILYVWNGGLAIYGGIIGGAISALLFAKRRNISVLTLFDMIVPGLALAQAIGRWGNFFNMEAYGVEITNPHLQFFPMAVQIMTNGELVWHSATFFYESVWNVCVFLFLWRIRKKNFHKGDSFLFYILLYGAGRLIIEGLRTDSLYTFGGNARISQLLSVAGCLTCLLVFVFRIISQKDWKFPVFAGLVTGIICFVFGSSVEPFLGANLVWALLGAILITGAVSTWAQQRRRQWHLLVIPCLLILCTCVRYLWNTNTAPLLSTVVLCALNSLLAIIGALMLYPYSRGVSQSATGGSSYADGKN